MKSLWNGGVWFWNLLCGWVLSLSPTVQHQGQQKLIFKAFSCSQIWWISYNHDCWIPINPMGTLCFPVSINFRMVFQLNLAVWKLLRASCKVELAVENLSEVLKIRTETHLRIWKNWLLTLMEWWLWIMTSSSWQHFHLSVFILPFKPPNFTGKCTFHLLTVKPFNISYS